jgi:hypothetical protein
MELAHPVSVPVCLTLVVCLVITEMWVGWAIAMIGARNGECGRRQRRLRRDEENEAILNFAFYP